MSIKVALSGASGNVGRILRVELQKRGVDLRSAGGTKPLEPLRPGRDYQLWVITPEGPRAADVFKVDAAGHAVVRMKHDIAPEQAAALLRRAGGGAG